MALAVCAPPATAQAKIAPEDLPDPVPDEPDPPRLRGGVSLTGGVMASTLGEIAAGVVGLEGRVGGRLTPSVGLHYLGRIFVAPSDGLSGGLWNTLLVTWTLRRFVDFGFGPSLDLYLIQCGGDACPGAPVPELGFHERVAFLLGRRLEGRPESRGFTVGLDFHQSYLPRNPLLGTLTAQVGYEWY